MRMLTTAIVGAAMIFSRSKAPTLKGRIGFQQGRRRVDPEVLLDEVTFLNGQGSRHFVDSVAVGVLRGLRSHLVTSDVAGVVEAAPPADGSFVLPHRSAYAHLERYNKAGLYVCAPISAGFDLPIRRQFVVSKEAPVNDPEFAILLVPGAWTVYRPAVFDPETGG